MPVQSATTEATAWASTLGRISGDSPCRACSWASSSLSSASRVCRSGSASASIATSTLPPSPRSLARSSRIWSTKPFSSCQRASSCARRVSSTCNFSLASAWRWAVSMPMAVSRAMISSSTFKPSIRRRQSSTSAGTACWLMATRAQAVSSRLTALSGNWRAGM